MPEGPEAKIISEILDKELSGEKVINVEIKDEKYKDLIILKNKKLLSVSSYGKKVIFHFSNLYLISSLGMSGKWLFSPLKHTKIIIFFAEKNLYFDDTRNFGSIEIFNENEITLEEILFEYYNLGIDVLREENPDEIKEILIKNKNRKISSVLEDQHVFSGIGRYLLNEILYESKLKPERKISSLSDEEIEILSQNILRIPRESYQAGGHSYNLNSFLNPYGEKGKYETRIYRKKSENIEKVKFRNRTIYLDKEVQK